jgi:hypothetical protein
MQKISDSRASFFNKGVSIGRARGAAEFSYKYSVYADKKIRQLMNQYHYCPVISQINSTGYRYRCREL